MAQDVLDDTRYFETYLDMFLHPGWKQFVEEMKEVRDTYDLDYCKDYDAFMIMRSARQQLARIINFEDQIRLSMDNQKADQEADETE